jgi:hypothetical protein
MAQQPTNPPAQGQSQQPYTPGQPHPSTTVKQPAGAVTTDSVRKPQDQARNVNQQGQQVGDDGLTDEQRKQKQREDEERAAHDKRAREGK